jgi:hypothetical protein
MGACSRKAGRARGHPGVPHRYGCGGGWEHGRAATPATSDPTPSTKDRSAALSFLASVLGAHHWVYSATARVEGLLEEGENTWTVEDHSIRVHGTKSAAAVRVVPKVGLHLKPEPG